MIKVGLTGNFHSGHREISKKFEKNNIPVFDVDLLIKYLINNNKKSREKIKQKFGEKTYILGSLNFLKFDTTKKFEELINFLTPEIFSTYEKFRQKNCKFPYTIFLSSILFEKKWNLYNNYNINVFKPEMIRKKSILSKSTIDINMLEYVLENEMSEYDKNSKSNFIIHNYAEKNLDFKIDNEILQIHSNLLRHCQNLDLEETF